ncbi:MAG: hypothetical protein ACR2NA_14155 [Solirubrobacterales bacterium]
MAHSAEDVVRLEAALADPEVAQRYLRTILLRTHRGFADEIEPHAVPAARCVLHLRHVLLEDGIVAWFAKPRPVLGGRSPREAMAAGDAEDAVRLARRVAEGART